MAAKKNTNQSSTPPMSAKDQKLFSKFLQEQLESKKDIVDFDSAIEDQASKIAAKEKEILSLLQERKKLASEVNDYARTMNDLLKNSTREQRKQSGDLVKEMSLKKKLYNQQLKQLDSAIESQKIDKLRAKAEENRLKNLKIYSQKADELTEKFEDQFEAIGEVDSLIKKLPGGGLLTKIIGTDKLQEKIQKQITDQLTNAQAAGSGLGKVLGKAAMTLGAFWAIAKFVEWFKEMDEETVKLAKDLDVSRDQAAEIHHEAHGIAEEIAVTGVHTEQVTKAMTELKSVTGLNFGLMAETNKAAKDLVATTALLVEKQGLSTEEAYSLSQAATITGVDMDNLALQAESMGDELMSGRDIMKEAGKVSKTVLTNFAKNPKELIKAVKQAKLLGTSLDAINDAGSQMLDVESSIENEMKANVLLGKHMNLNAARQAALNGETATLMSEIAEQAGSAEEFDKMNVVQKKALADAVGMQVDQLAEMMTKQKELTKLGYTQEQLDKSMALTGTARAKELERIQKLKGKEAAEALKAKYIEQDRVTTTEAFSSAITEATDAMKTTLLPVVQAIAKGLTTFAPVIKPLTIGLAALAAVALSAMVISKAASGIKAGLGAVKGLFGGGGGPMDVITDQADKADKLTEKTKSIGDKIADFGKGIGSFLKDVGKGVGDAISGLLSGIAEGLKALGKAGIEGLIGVALLGALGLALWAFKPIVVALTPLIIRLAEVVGKTLVEALKASGPIIETILKGIAVIIETAGDVIAKVITTIADSLVKISTINGGNLLAVAAGITAVSVSLAAFGAGGALSGIGGAIGEFFGGDPVEKFKAFESIDASKLNAVAAAITVMGTAIRSFTDALDSVGDVDPILDTVDKVMELHDALTESTGEKILSGIGDAVEGVFSAATDWVASMPGLEGVFGSGGESAAGGGAKKETSLTEVAGLLKDLIAKVEQPVNINISNKTVDTLGRQISMRKTYASNLDQSYGVKG